MASDSMYIFWFLLYGVMLAFILLLHWRIRPERKDWKKIIIISLLFEIPFNILNILGITVFKFWQNNAKSPFPTIFGSPIEDIPFAFLGAVLTLLLLRLTKTPRWKGMIWFLIALICALQAFLSTLIGFLTWINWNFVASYLFWLTIIGILIVMDYTIKLN